MLLTISSGLQKEDGLDRRFQLRLGGAVRRQTGFRPLVEKGRSSSHQLPGSAGSVFGPSHLSVRAKGVPRLMPVSHMLHLQCACGPCALRTLCRSSTDSLCFHTGHVCSQLLIRGCLPQTLVSIILISNPNVVRLYQKCFFSIAVILFYHSTVTQSFIDIFTFKLN